MGKLAVPVYKNILHLPGIKAINSNQVEKNVLNSIMYQQREYATELRNSVMTNRNKPVIRHINAPAHIINKSHVSQSREKYVFDTLTKDGSDV